MSTYVTAYMYIGLGYGQSPCITSYACIWKERAVMKIESYEEAKAPAALFEIAAARARA